MRGAINSSPRTFKESCRGALQKLFFNIQGELFVPIKPANHGKKCKYLYGWDYRGTVRSKLYLTDVIVRGIKHSDIKKKYRNEGE